MFTNQDITNFQKLYKEQFECDISADEAREQGSRLLSLMSSVYKPMTQEEHCQVDQHCSEVKASLIERMGDQN